MAQNLAKISDLTSLRLEHSVFKQKVWVDSEASSDGLFFLRLVFHAWGGKKVPEVWICILFIDDIYTFSVDTLLVFGVWKEEELQ